MSTQEAETTSRSSEPASEPQGDSRQATSSSSVSLELEHDDEDLQLDPLQEICEAWSGWVRTRRFFKAPSLPPSVLGRLTSRTRAMAGGPDAWNSAELQALNTAIEAEPIDALDRQVFELHYRHRVKGIKTFAAALGISRSHWYNLLRSFEQRVCDAGKVIEAKNLAARDALRSIAAASDARWTK